MRAISQTRHDARARGTTRNGPAERDDAERRRTTARRDRDQRPDHGADRAGGRDGADAASAQHRRVEVGRRRATESRRALAAAEDRSADDEERKAAGPDREAADERSEREQAQTRDQHRLATEVLQRCC